MTGTIAYIATPAHAGYTPYEFCPCTMGVFFHSYVLKLLRLMTLARPLLTHYLLSLGHKS